MRRKTLIPQALIARAAFLVLSLVLLAYFTACAPDSTLTVQTTTKSGTPREASGQSASPSPPRIPTADSASDLSKGEQIWTNNCFACHGTGLAGAPKIGDRSIWAPRVAQGMDVLIEHALNGLQGKSGSEMPPKGGNPALSTDEVAAAVTYMVTRSR